MSTAARSGKKTTAGTAVVKRVPAPPRPHTVTHAALVEHLASGAVAELVAVEFERGHYRLEASLSWRSGKSVLVAARGGERVFRSLDTLATFLTTIGTGPTLVRLQLK
jgi:hypothetical protein